MNYQRIHNQLISFYQENPPEGYSERHHIIPRCLGGTNEKTNLVRLPARVHFTIHLLLAKIHGGKLIYAVQRLSYDGKHGSRYYAWVKTAFIKQKSIDMMANKIMVGRKASHDTKIKLSIVRRGNKNAAGHKGRIPWNKGKKYKQKSEKIHGSIGQKRTEEQRRKCSLAQLGNTKGKGKLGKKYGSMSADGKMRISEGMKKARSERFWSTKPRSG